MRKIRTIAAGSLALAALLAQSFAASAQVSSNPGRDFNQQQYERRYDPGAYSGPTYNRNMNPGQQYNDLLNERRYRVSPGVDRNRYAVDGAPRRDEGASSPRVRSVKPARKTPEDVRRRLRKKKNVEVD